MKYDSYREKIEQQHNKALVEVIKDFYIEQDLGPSVSAKNLGIPRRVFMHFVQAYGLRKLKFENYKKKMIFLPERQMAR
ncbi:hypothetical protein [Planococcus sp. CPCC 101016]|uniref:hypothetical protein n=1 Tax=Planococcus sp. CPCC 101016 TaxID=2599617 RepID=UPI0021BD90EE|nr:hypothetical protein [Planococcus sp. CPCC 101016]